MLLSLIKNHPWTIAILLAFAMIPAGTAQTAAPKNQSSNGRSPKDIQPLTDRLDGMMPPLLDSANIPGLSLAVIRNGKIVYTQGYGVKSAETKEKVDVNTVFDAASLSKCVFAYGAVKLVDQGKLDLDKPLHQYLPYPDIAYDERYKLITARMVLSHATGFPNWRGSDSLRINFTPGKQFSYSGEGFVYLQKVVEKITGKPLNDFLTETVFTPLGMTRTSYVWPKHFDENFALSHDSFGLPAGKNKPEKANAAYSLQTTAQDYARFMSAILNGTGLSKSALAQLLTVQMPVPEEKFNPASPLSQSIGWGLGVGLQKTAAGTSFWHWGDNNTFKCYMAASPATKNGVVFFTNSSNGLSIVEEVVRETIGGEQPAIAFLGYDSYKSPGSLFMRNLRTKGVKEAIAPFRNAAGKSTVSENKMNQIGYDLLRQKKNEEALEVFKLNMEAYPNSGNVYDSYAEGCLVNGDYKTAAEYYRKAYSLDPKNTSAGHLASQLTEGCRKANTLFSLKGYPHAKLVTVAGNFNQWNSLHTILFKNGDAWINAIVLPPGKYQYKFVVDGQWILDPANPSTAEENGHQNSQLVVK